MYSQSKTEDKKYLLELGELIELLTKVGTTESIDLALKFGEQYLELQNKINGHDYSPNDRFYESISLSPHTNPLA